MIGQFPVKISQESSNNLLLQVLKSPEAQLIGAIAEKFQSEGVEINPKLCRTLIDFIRMRANFLSIKEFESKRKLELGLSSRLNMLKNILSQMEKDNGYFRSPYVSGFVEQQLFVALFEKAILIYESRVKNHPRDTLAFGFHLLALKDELANQNIDKPVEVISFILAQTNAVYGVSTNWSVRTIKNKLSQALGSIDASFKKGACHNPQRIGDWPRASSLAFIKRLSGGCQRCEAGWLKILGSEKAHEKSCLAMAEQELKKDFPEVSDLLSGKIKKFENMPLRNLLDLMPKRIHGFVPHLISEFSSQSLN